MAEWQQGKWVEPPEGGMTPAMAPALRLAASGGGARPRARLDGVLVELYDEAMARFDAFCFWYARPPRTPAGIREVAKRLEAYGSPESLRIAEEVRAALADE